MQFRAIYPASAIGVPAMAGLVSAFLRADGLIVHDHTLFFGQLAERAFIQKVR
jgi:hypothetical protein